MGILSTRETLRRSMGDNVLHFLKDQPKKRKGEKSEFDSFNSSKAWLLIRDQINKSHQPDLRHTTLKTAAQILEAHLRAGRATTKTLECVEQLHHRREANPSRYQTGSDWPKCCWFNVSLCRKNTNTQLFTLTSVWQHTHTTVIPVMVLWLRSRGG